MRRVMLAGPAMGPALAGLPVLVIGPDTVEAHATRYRAARSDLIPARLWVARGRDWRGPFRGWREALEALAGVCPAPDLPRVAMALQTGRGTPLGAVAMAGGWRYRLAWGGTSPPSRY